MLSAGSGSWPGLPRRLAVQLRERREALGHPADDRERHRQPERAGADRRLRRAADRDPHRQRILHRPRVDAAVLDPLRVLARPRQPLGVADREQHPQLLVEERVVVVRS